MKKTLPVVLAIITLLSSLSIFANASLFDSKKLTDEQKQLIKANYEEFISEVDGDSSKIPMIVSTDQHGAVTISNDTFDYVNEIADWSKISKILNLGDTVKLFFNPFELIGYRIATKNLPAEKRIEIFGNHDGHILPARLFVAPFFPTKGAEQSPKKDAFIVKDEQFNVCYISIDPMSFPWSYEGGTLSSEQAEFLLINFRKTQTVTSFLFLTPTFSETSLSDAAVQPSPVRNILSEAVRNTPMSSSHLLTCFLQERTKQAVF